VWPQPNLSTHATMNKLNNMIFDDRDDLIYIVFVASAATLELHVGSRE
jgi:hypothetical protein